MYQLVRIVLKNGKPMYKKQEVVLGTIQNAILVGKGEGSSVLMHFENLRLKKDEIEQ